MTEEKFKETILDRTTGALIQYPSFFQHRCFMSENVKEITNLKQEGIGDDSFRIIMDDGEEFQIIVKRTFTPR